MSVGKPSFPNQISVIYSVMSNTTVFITNKELLFSIKLYHSLALLIAFEYDMKSETTLQKKKKQKLQNNRLHPHVNMNLL